MPNTKNSSFRKAFYHLKMAETYFDDEARERPMKLSGDVSKKYNTKLKWIFNDFNTDIRLPKSAQEEFKNELNGDIMFFDSISRKSLELSEKQRAVVENIIDCVLKGEKVIVDIDNHEPLLNHNKI